MSAPMRRRLVLPLERGFLGHPVSVLASAAAFLTGAALAAFLL